MTKEERHLWYDFLKPYHKAFGIVFVRQKIFDRYIADFYCPRAKMVIELDGSQHYDPEALEYDRERTAFLNHLGIEVVRYTNRDIHTRFKDICSDIDYHIQNRIREIEE